jgi:pantetheine-phosphate adenylyltransferase
MARIAIYPGTFDPITLGHMDIITRGAGLFDRLIVGVATNTEKRTLFSVDERMAFIRASVALLPQVEVARVDGLLVRYAHQIGATILLRGLRAMSDFEKELQMAAMNRKLAPRIETVFLVSSEQTSCISSRLVKEVAGMGGDVSAFVSDHVQTELCSRLAGQKETSWP